MINPCTSKPDDLIGKSKMFIFIKNRNNAECITEKSAPLVFCKNIQKSFARPFSLVFLRLKPIDFSLYYSFFKMYNCSNICFLLLANPLLLLLNRRCSKLSKVTFPYFSKVRIISSCAIIPSEL